MAEQRAAQPDDHREIGLAKIGEGRYLATNGRGGVLPIGRGEDPDFTPVELLLAALAGCSAADVDLITGKRVEATGFDVAASGVKVRDDDGHHLADLRLRFEVTFPDGPDGDRARAMLPRALAQTRDRLCTVARTVSVGQPISYALGDEPV